MDGDDDGGRGLYAWKEKFLLLRGREGGEMAFNHFIHVLSPAL